MSESPSFLLEVTDLKQYRACPRIPFYRYCLPQIRPVTVLMEEGIRQHEQEDQREERRSLRNYGLREGERYSHLVLQSTKLRLSGKLDLAIAVPGKEIAGAEAIVVEYKYTEAKAGPHFKLQLAAYALLVEEAWQLPVKRGYIYSIPLRRAEAYAITPQLRRQVTQTVERIHTLIARESMPEATSQQGRCVYCEFRRFCNDVV